MTTVITRFPLRENANASKMSRALATVAPSVRGVPGLLHKQFRLAADCRSAGDGYLRESEAAARVFRQECVAPTIQEKFHVEPVVAFYASPVIVEDSLELDVGDPVEMGEQYAQLRALMPHLSVIGGGCGTDHRHVATMCDGILRSPDRSSTSYVSQNH